MSPMQPCAAVACTCAAEVKVAHVLQVADVEIFLVSLLILIDPLHNIDSAAEIFTIGHMIYIRNYLHALHDR